MPPAKQPMVNVEAVMNAIKEIGDRLDKRIDDIAAVAKLAADESKSAAITIAEIKATLNALKESLEGITSVVKEHADLKERVAKLEPGNVFKCYYTLNDRTDGIPHRWYEHYELNL